MCTKIHTYIFTHMGVKIHRPIYTCIYTLTQTAQICTSLHIHTILYLYIHACNHTRFHNFKVQVMVKCIIYTAFISFAIIIDIIIILL